MQTDIPIKLERLGLTHNEAKVYLALLEVGPSATKALIRKTGIHTSKVYESLERLIQKGLANFVIEANRKKFSATDPQSIIGFLDEKQMELEDKKKEVVKLLPSLRSLRRAALPQSASVFSGIKGYKAMLDNMLKELGEGGHYDAFASGRLKAELGPFWNHFQRKKEKMGIRSRCLWDEGVRSQKEYLKEYFGKGRFIPSGSYNAPTDIFIYKDKVLLVSYVSKPIFAVLIHSAGMSKSYAELFNTLWKIGKE
ncbi:MAG: helix-turn-helix domain-containing protein [Candidatus Burarchaeum sp.]|nr:helix-turn-helix domain-containing protein [Candidatus Burarchaeum sp.]MDO8339602.1 helix-turn-helix domain-containing protein [Candidatus Burarchaeum sp.]